MLIINNRIHYNRFFFLLFHIKLIFSLSIRVCKSLMNHLSYKKNIFYENKKNQIQQQQSLKHQTITMNFYHIGKLFWVVVWKKANNFFGSTFIHVFLLEKEKEKRIFKRLGQFCFYCWRKYFFFHWKKWKIIFILWSMYRIMSTNNNNNNKNFIFILEW